MSTFYEKRESDSPFIQYVWRALPKEAGGYIDIPTENWSIMVSIKNDLVTTFLVGPKANLQPITYAKGVEYFGIVFKPHTFMLNVSKQSIINQTKTVTNFSEIPTYKNAEVFVAQLIKDGFLLVDKVVADVLIGETHFLSIRSLQLHFLKTTGFTLNYIRQIERAQNAKSLLQKGMSILDVVFKSGFSDQSHMTKSFKRLLGKTPAQITKTIKAE